LDSNDYDPLSADENYASEDEHADLKKKEVAIISFTKSEAANEENKTSHV
jgi:hypothetical protein